MMLEKTGLTRIQLCEVKLHIRVHSVTIKSRIPFALAEYRDLRCSTLVDLHMNLRPLTVVLRLDPNFLGSAEDVERILHTLALQTFGDLSRFPVSKSSVTQGLQY